MNILVITDNDQKKLFQSVKSLIKSSNTQNTANQFHVQYRSFDDLKEFTKLYKNIQDNQACLKFDSFDLVIIEINHKIKPWFKKVDQVEFQFQLNKFILFCIKTNKPIFASGGAFNLLVYLCATNFESTINVINGKIFNQGSNGSHIQEIHQIHNQFSKLLENDYFLDQNTGDLLNSYYSNDNQIIWKPQANIGQHYSQVVLLFKCSKSNDLPNDYFQNRSCNLKNISGNLFLQSKFDHMCQISKDFMQHFLFKNIQNHFVVQSKSYWIMHKFSFLNQQKKIKILAESKINNSPIVIQVQDFIYSGSFYIDQNYINSFTFLQNFIEYFQINNQYFQQKKKTFEFLNSVSQNIDQNPFFVYKNNQQQPSNLRKYKVSNNSIRSSKNQDGEICIQNQNSKFDVNHEISISLLINNFMDDDNIEKVTTRPISAIQRNINNVTQRTKSVKQNNQGEFQNQYKLSEGNQTQGFKKTFRTQDQNYLENYNNQQSVKLDFFKIENNINDLIDVNKRQQNQITIENQEKCLYYPQERVYIQNQIKINQNKKYNQKEILKIDTSKINQKMTLSKFYKNIIIQSTRNG